MSCLNSVDQSTVMIDDVLVIGKKWHEKKRSVQFEITLEIRIQIYSMKRSHINASVMIYRNHIRDKDSNLFHEKVAHKLISNDVLFPNDVFSQALFGTLEHHSSNFFRKSLVQKQTLIFQ